LRGLHKLWWCCKTPNFICLDTYGCFRWWIFFIFSKNQSLEVLTPCVALNCLLRNLVLWPKYNVIISKSITFHVDCDFIIQIPSYSYIILVWSNLLKTYGKLSFGTILWCIQYAFTPIINTNFVQNKAIVQCT
jgi:hypothetical protein